MHEELLCEGVLLCLNDQICLQMFSLMCVYIFPYFPICTSNYYVGIEKVIAYEYYTDKDLYKLTTLHAITLALAPLL